ncbi:MAG: GNAT family N-acetyltransferase [Pseudomonadota bacterium]
MKHIRPYRDTDLQNLHAINVAGEPGVGAVSIDQLKSVIELGHCTVAVDDTDNPLGFLLLHMPEAEYDSQNFKWFDDRYEDFVYVDRIAVSPEARSQEVGAALYAHAFEAFTGKALLIGCEVNAVPPNPRSLHFHQRLGFRQVGEKTYTADYAVIYLARRLTV